MPTLILASSSPQRRMIMKLLQVPFKVMPSKAKEIITHDLGAKSLVKHNALIKAKDVARRVQKGIVIGCDTVVYSGYGRLILKPADLKEAKKNLKELMAKPHWVYSGLAVVDAASRREKVVVEGTKVFMRPLSDRLIDTYHALVNPLDKAGGFDIEGHGSIFIPRIEGCFYNVVGLPVSKLAQILEEFGVPIL